jgi:hypothetical protein
LKSAAAWRDRLIVAEVTVSVKASPLRVNPAMYRPLGSATCSWKRPDTRPFAKRPAHAVIRQPVRVVTKSRYCDSSSSPGPLDLVSPETSLNRNQVLHLVRIFVKSYALLRLSACKLQRPAAGRVGGVPNSEFINRSNQRTESPRNHGWRRPRAAGRCRSCRRPRS